MDGAEDRKLSGGSPVEGTKLKRITFDVHPEIYFAFKGWCAKNGLTVREEMERFMISALMETGEFSEAQKTRLWSCALGRRRGSE